MNEQEQQQSFSILTDIADQVVQLEAHPVFPTDELLDEIGRIKKKLDHWVEFVTEGEE